jgi:cystathionine beta-lyase
MKYDFDRVIDRRNTNSLKFDFAREFGKPEDALPLWVADMDFQAPIEVINALKETADHGIFGYSGHKEDYLQALHKWFRERFAWDFADKTLVKAPGAVFAIANAVRACTQEGDSVLIKQPVYYPFAGVVRDNNRKLVINSLVRNGDSRNDISKNDTAQASVVDNDYSVDFAAFERQIVEEQVRLFILCSPHNPIGRVWSAEELRRMGEICLRHNVLIISDEIHADFVYRGNKHTIFPSLAPELAEITILCTAPSKTFNLAGLQVANIFISNSSLRQKFETEINRSGFSLLSVMGLRACQAAYEYGADWLDQLLDYLQNNLLWLEQFVRDEIPQITLIRPQGTYLVWLDFRRFMPDDNQRRKFMLDEAKIWLDDGPMFGAEGSGYERINIACPRSVLEQAMHQLKRAMENVSSHDLPLC